jgi:hypothetical protein
VFLDFHNNGLIKCRSVVEGLSDYKILWSNVDWCKFCIHHRNLNSPQLEWFKVRDYKVWRRGCLLWHVILNELYKNDIKRWYTKRHNGGLINLTFLFKESILKHVLRIVVEFRRKLTFGRGKITLLFIILLQRLSYLPIFQVMSQAVWASLRLDVIKIAMRAVWGIVLQQSALACCQICRSV